MKKVVLILLLLVITAIADMSIGKVSTTESACKCNLPFTPEQDPDDFYRCKATVRTKGKRLDLYKPCE